MWTKEELNRMIAERDNKKEPEMHFGFESNDYNTCEERYQKRIEYWRNEASRQKKTPADMERLHDKFWFLHNLVAHPALGLFPCDVTVWLHSVTSDLLNDERQSADWNRVGYKSWAERVPKIPDRWKWFVHNVIAHIGIGLFPGKSTFDFHDKTAKEMDVPGWV